MPTRFFHESEKQFDTSFIANAIAKYGQHILIGGDPGYGDEFENAMRQLDHRGAYKHVYLVGCGMEVWSKEEAEEIKQNAKSIGIDVSKSTWKKTWFSSGWITKVEEWFTTYNALGFYSAEIDNIDVALENDPKKLVKFYLHLKQFCERNKIQTKLMVKNLSEAELKEVIANKSSLDGFLAPWGMFENGTGDAKAQTKLAAQLGIMAVTPLNGLRTTENYGTIRTGIPAL